jgi:Uma2 family endonuclease
MAVAQRIDAATYERLAVHAGYRFVELRDGVLVEKPPVSFRHARTIERVGRDLRPQLNPDDYLVFVESSRLRVGESYLVPDLVAIQTAVERVHFDRDPNQLAVYDEPVPLVVEVWSPSTGAYDLVGKLPLYQARADREIWFVHPVERTLTAWVRRDDGSYAELVYRGGVVKCSALPGVRIDLGALLG